jgi:hypothetical protein
LGVDVFPFLGSHPGGGFFILIPGIGLMSASACSDFLRSAVAVKLDTLKDKFLHLPGLKYYFQSSA